MRRFFFGLCLIVLLCVALSTWQGQSGKAVNMSSTLNSLVQQARQHSGTSTSTSTGVEGHPTISADFINKILAAAGSKAAGTGQALYDDGVQYGIDPVYALAFFYHESAFGTTGMARATLSLGNIRCTSGYQCIEGFRAYQSWQAGYEDWFKLIRNLYINQWGLRTVEQIIPTYAPAGDHNNVAGYIAAIENAVRTWRAEASKITNSGVKLAA